MSVIFFVSQILNLFAFVFMLAILRFPAVFSLLLCALDDSDEFRVISLNIKIKIYSAAGESRRPIKNVTNISKI